MRNESDLLLFLIAKGILPLWYVYNLQARKTDKLELTSIFPSGEV